MRGLQRCVLTIVAYADGSRGYRPAATFAAMPWVRPTRQHLIKDPAGPMPNADSTHPAHPFPHRTAVALATLVFVLAAACTSPDQAMTPDRAQATVTAYAVQTTATASARAASEQAMMTATAVTRAAEQGTATAVTAAAAATTAAVRTATAAAEAAQATATAMAMPTATPTVTPTITPTPGPRYAMAVGGQGEVQTGSGATNFGFGIGRRSDGQIEGWLQYSSALGALQATQITRLDTHLGTAGFWGFGTLPEVTDRVSFNANIVSTGQGGGPGVFRVTVFRANGQQLFTEGGQVIRGMINVSGP